MEQTIEAYRRQWQLCKTIFGQKHEDYAASWVLMRPRSLIDQLMIKARRLQHIQMVGMQKVQENQAMEFCGLVNYAVMCLIRLDLPQDWHPTMAFEPIGQRYDQCLQACLDLLVHKNHDYAEIWRSMKIESMTDIILTKLFRMQQILDHGVKHSEGVEANLADVINYAIFCLILHHEQDHQR